MIFSPAHHDLKEASDPTPNVLGRTLGHEGGGDGRNRANAVTREDPSTIDQGKAMWRSMCDGRKDGANCEDDSEGKEREFPPNARCVLLVSFTNSRIVMRYEPSTELIRGCDDSAGRL